MNKLELVHLHQLLACVTEDRLERGGVDATDLEAYRELDIAPTSIQEPLARHQAAVETLAGLLTASLEPAETATDRVVA